MTDGLPPEQGVVIERATEEMIASEPASQEEIPAPESTPETAPVEDQVQQVADAAQSEAVASASAEDAMIAYSAQLLSRALHRSQTNNFAAVGLPFSDLEILSRVVSLVQKRSQLLNMLTSQVHARDVSLAQKSKIIADFFQTNLVFLESLARHLSSGIDAIKSNQGDMIQATDLAKAVHELSILFLPTGNNNEENKG